MFPSHQPATDADLAALDVPALLRTGLPGDPRLFADGAIAGALAAGRLEVLPRSLTFLAEIVRRGGVAYAATLPEPLPTPEATELARTWLAAAAEVTGLPQLELSAATARWLDAVALIVNARLSRSN
jgi:hypothetical protein